MKRAYEFVAWRAGPHGDWYLSYGGLSVFLDQYGKVRSMIWSGLQRPLGIFDELRDHIRTAVLAYGLEHELPRLRRGSDEKRRLIEYVATCLNETIPPMTWRDR